MSTRLSSRCEHRCWRLELASLAGPPLSCTCGPPVTGAQMSDIRLLWLLRSAQRRPIHSGPLLLRQDSAVLKSNFPAQLLKALFVVGFTSGGTASLAEPARLPTTKAPHSYQKNVSVLTPAPSAASQFHKAVEELRRVLPTAAIAGA